MQNVVRISLSLFGVAALAVACRGNLPPTEPPRSGDASPGTRTDDNPVASPRAGEPIPGSRESTTASGGSNGLPLPTPPGGSTSPTP
jgi:hypothetical protein